MQNKHYVSFVLGALLIPLVWIGIVLIDHLHQSTWFIAAVVIWALVFAADLVATVWLSAHSRGERVDGASRHRPAA